MKQNIFLCLLLIGGSCVLINGLKFKNLHCEILKPDWAIIKECRIQALNRTRNVINLRVTLLKTLKDCKVNFKLLKRELGGWHPFLYAMTLDICDFFKHPKKYKIPGLIYSYLRPYTNVRSTCPYMEKTDIYLTGWQLDEKSVISRFPVDFGEYGIHTTWYHNGTKAAQVNGSLAYTPYN